MLEYALTELWRRQERGFDHHRGLPRDSGASAGALARSAERALWERADASELQAAERVLIQMVRPGEQLNAGGQAPDTRRVASRDDFDDAPVEPDPPAGQRPPRRHHAAARGPRYRRAGARGSAGRLAAAGRLGQRQPGVPYLAGGPAPGQETMAEPTVRARPFLLDEPGIAEAREWERRREEDLTSAERDFIATSVTKASRRRRRRRSLFSARARWPSSRPWWRASSPSSSTSAATSSIATACPSRSRVRPPASTPPSRTWPSSSRSPRTRSRRPPRRTRAYSAGEGSRAPSASPGSPTPPTASTATCSSWPPASRYACGTRPPTASCRPCTANGGVTGHRRQLREHGAGRRGRQRDHPAVERDATGASHRQGATQLATGSVGPVSQLAFSPGTDLLGSAGWDHRVRLWNVSDPRHPVLLASIAGGCAGFHQARCRLLPATAPGTCWPRADWDGFVRPLGHHQPPAATSLAGRRRRTARCAHSVAFSPAGSVLAIGGDDSTNPAISNGDNLYLWDVGNPRAPRRLTAIASGLSNVAAVAFSPTAPLLAASGSFASATALWNIADPGRPSSLPSLKGGSLCLAFSPDGQTLATLDQAVRATRSPDDEVELWSIGACPDAGRPRDGLDRIGIPTPKRSVPPVLLTPVSSPSPAVPRSPPGSTPSSGTSATRSAPPRGGTWAPPAARAALARDGYRLLLAFGGSDTGYGVVSLWDVTNLARPAWIENFPIGRARRHRDRHPRRVQPGRHGTGRPRYRDRYHLALVTEQSESHRPAQAVAHRARHTPRMQTSESMARWSPTRSTGYRKGPVPRPRYGICAAHRPRSRWLTRAHSRRLGCISRWLTCPSR